MPRTVEELRAIITAGDFLGLVGTFEDDHLDGKATLYEIGSDRGKYEFAKDCASMANGGGGFILLGVAAVKTDENSRDRISAIVGVDPAQFDHRRYRDCLEQWTYPRLSVSMDVVTTREGPAVVVVEIADIASDWPAMTTRIARDDGSMTELLVAIPERIGDANRRMRTDRLHTLLRDGRRIVDEQRAEFRGLSAVVTELRDEIRRLREPDDAPDPDREARLLDAHVAAALAAASLPDEGAFILAARLQGRISFDSLFESRGSAAVRSLESPPAVRDAGFDIDAGDRSEIVAGSIRRAMIPTNRILEAHRDGTVIFALRGDEDGLTWGSQRHPDRNPRINQLLLVEQTYLFVRLVIDLFQVDLLRSMLFRIELRGLHRGRSRVGLPIGRVGGLALRVRDAPGPTVKVEKANVLGIGPERIAARLLGLVFNQFGFATDEVPYTREANGGREVDVDSIRDASR